jgi:hypothetical protein
LGQRFRKQEGTSCSTVHIESIFGLIAIVRGSTTVSNSDMGVNIALCCAHELVLVSLTTLCRLHTCNQQNNACSSSLASRHALVLLFIAPLMFSLTFILTIYAPAAGMCRAYDCHTVCALLLLYAVTQWLHWPAVETLRICSRAPNSPIDSQGVWATLFLGILLEIHRQERRHDI